MENYEEYETLTTPWHSITIAVEAPWYLYTIIIDDISIFSEIKIGTPVIEMTSIPVGYSNPLLIAAFLYKDTSTMDVYTENGPNREIFAIIIKDRNDQLITFDLEESYEGDITFLIVSNQEDVDQINCFKREIAIAQCKFALAVEKYTNQLYYSIICCNALENLKQYKRTLELLNSYDVRDLVNKTKDYNYFSYKKIIKILHSIKL